MHRAGVLPPILLDEERYRRLEREAPDLRHVDLSGDVVDVLAGLEGE